MGKWVKSFLVTVHTCNKNHRAIYSVGYNSDSSKNSLSPIISKKNKETWVIGCF